MPVTNKPQQLGRFKFADLRDVQAEDVQHIVDLHKAGKSVEMAAAFGAFCATIKDLKQYEAFMLWRRVTR